MKQRLMKNWFRLSLFVIFDVSKFSPSAQQNSKQLKDFELAIENSRNYSSYDLNDLLDYAHQALNLSLKRDKFSFNVH